MEDETEYGLFYVGIIVLALLITPCFALPQLSYDSPTSTYILSDKTGGKTYEVARLTLIENTNQCFSDCYAKIKVNVTNQTLFNTYLGYLAYNDNSIYFKNMNLTYEAPYLYLRATKKINSTIISKNGNEERISIPSYDWILNIQGIALSEWAWFNTSWLYRRQINFTNYNQQLNNFTIAFSINTTSLYEAGKLNSTCNDLRFTNSSDSELRYDIASCIVNSNSTNSTILVELPYILNGSNSIYVYYGNNASSDNQSSLNGLFYNNTFAYYKMDSSSGSSVYDELKIRNFTRQYNTNWTNGIINNGLNQSVLNITGFGNTGDMSSLANQFTINFWAKANQNNPNGWIGWFTGISYQSSFSVMQHEGLNITRIYFAGCGDISAPYHISYGNWEMLTFTKNGSNFLFYVNGTLVYNTGCINTPTWSTTFYLGDGHNDANPGSVYSLNNGSIDELGFWNRSLTATEIKNLTQARQFLGVASLGSEENGEQSPIITFLNQTPAFITPITLFNERLNISYSITDTDSTPLNNSTVQIYYKINTTTQDGAIYVNGTLLTEYENTSYDLASGSVYNFSLGDSKVYPASYNIDQQYMQQTAKINYALSGSNHYIFQEILNVTPSNLTIVEMYAIPPVSTSTLQLWICNQSKVANIQTSSSCFLLCNILNTQAYNHTHTVNSKHYVCSYSVNSTNQTHNVKVNPTMYIYARPSNNQVWYIEYITNTSRVNATMYSNNSGTAYSQLSGTTDSHFHFYNGNETAYYKVCANDTVPSQTCSSERNITINTTIYPPSTPFVYIPNSSVVYYKNTTVPIFYTNATTFDNSTLTYYNISLLSSGLGYLATIIANNGLNTNYSANLSAIANGYYIIRVEICNTNNLCSQGYSELFRLQSPFVLNPNKREIVRCIKEIVTI